MKRLINIVCLLLYIIPLYSQNTIDYYSKQIEQDPSNPSSYYNRGTLKGLNKDYKGAIEDFDRALDLKPVFEKAYIFILKQAHRLSIFIFAIDLPKKALICYLFRGGEY